MVFQVLKELLGQPDQRDFKVLSVYPGLLDPQEQLEIVV